MGHECLHLNGIARTDVGEPIVCRHLASHAYQTWMGAVYSDYSSLKSIESVNALAVNTYDTTNFLQQKNMVICSLEKIGTALQYTQNLDQSAAIQRCMVLTSGHVLCVFQNREVLSRTTLYDPNETNAYYESSDFDTDQLSRIGSQMKIDIPAMESYLKGIESVCLLTEHRDHHQSRSRLLRCWTQEPYEALGWCLRQSELLGAKAVMRKFTHHSWNTITTAQAHFLSKAEPYLSHHDISRFKTIVCQSNISDSHKTNILNNCLPFHGRSAA